MTPEEQLHYSSSDCEMCRRAKIVIHALDAEIERRDDLIEVARRYCNASNQHDAHYAHTALIAAFQKFDAEIRSIAQDEGDG